MYALLCMDKPHLAAVAATAANWTPLGHASQSYMALRLGMAHKCAGDSQAIATYDDDLAALSAIKRAAVSV